MQCCGLLKINAKCQLQSVYGGQRCRPGVLDFSTQNLSTTHVCICRSRVCIDSFIYTLTLSVNDNLWINVCFLKLVSQTTLNEELHDMAISLMIYPTEDPPRGTLFQYYHKGMHTLELISYYNWYTLYGVVSDPFPKQGANQK